MDIYGIAWKSLERKIASTRRQSISKSDLTQWQLEALEEAVDKRNSTFSAAFIDPIPSHAR